MFILLSNHKIEIDIICIQETHLLDDHVYLPGYQAIVKSRKVKRGGGVLILVRNSLRYEIINLDIDLEIVGIKLIGLHDNAKILNIFSWYLPPKEYINLKQLSSILPKMNTLLAGDINAHNKLWGSCNTDHRGRIIHDFLDSNKLISVNNKQYTRINYNGSTSNIDTIFVSSHLGNSIDFKVLSDNCGSDHFPLFVEVFNHHSFEVESRYSLNYLKTDWKKFNEDFKQKGDDLLNENHGNVSICLLETFSKLFKECLKKTHQRTVTPIRIMIKSLNKCPIGTGIVQLQLKKEKEH